jgi:hypothetical protein
LLSSVVSHVVKYGSPLIGICVWFGGLCSLSLCVVLCCTVWIHLVHSPAYHSLFTVYSTNLSPFQSLQITQSRRDIRESAGLTSCSNLNACSWSQYCHVVQWLRRGFGLVIGFINNLQVVTTINYTTTASLHNLQSLHANILRPTSCSLLCSGFNSLLQLMTDLSVKVKVTLRLTVSQSISFGVEPHLGLMTRYILLFERYCLVFVERRLWREDGSVFCICCWPSPAQYFSGPSPVGLVAIFYCLRFETSLFDASYDSQGHGGSIRPRFYTGNLSVTAFTSLINLRYGPHRNTAFIVEVEPCLQRHCLATGCITLLFLLLCGMDDIESTASSIVAR